MQQATEKRATRRRKADADSKDAKAPVLSLAAARVRRATRRRNEVVQEVKLPAELTGLDLRGIDFERMTPKARQHFWFNLNRDARRMYAGAIEMSERECGQTFGPVTADHVQESERRYRARRKSERPEQFGLGFALDALQILGAAVCGALATKPELLGNAGPFPLAIALTMTVTVFLAREILTQRTS